MKPILFHIGSLPLYSFGLMVALGVMCSLWLMSLRARKTGFPEGDGAFDMVFVVVISGFLGARLYYIIQNMEWYFRHPIKIFALWEGGLIFYGGLIASFFGLWIFLRFKKVSFAKGLDFILPYVALSHAFGRIGCFFNGCCYGKVCHLPWAVSFPEIPHPVHPTQLYEAAADLILFLFLNFYYGKKRFDGEIAAFYFMIYAFIRFGVEMFRDDNPLLGILTVNQWVSALVFLTGLTIYFLNRKRGRS